MVHSNAETVEAYLDGLEPDRSEAISQVRQTILANLPDGYEEMMLHGMIYYGVPLTTFPKTAPTASRSCMQLSPLRRIIWPLYLSTVCTATNRWPSGSIKRYQGDGQEAGHGQVLCALPETG